MAKQEPTGSTVHLDEQMCFALYAASRAMTSRYRIPLSPLGLTYPQYLVIILLLDHGSSSVGHLGEQLQLESSTLSPLLKRLESMGLVTRSRDTNDERSVIIELTEAGLDLRSTVNEVNIDICQATGMDEAERVSLIAQLQELAAHLEASVDH